MLPFGVRKTKTGVLILVLCATILYSLPLFIKFKIDEALSEEFSTPERSIHFHETSQNGLLNSRQACAVESAARAHPGWQINVFFLGAALKDNLHKPSMKTLRDYTNVRLVGINLTEYTKGSPVESIVMGGKLKKSRYRVSHTSDVLRYLTLYKWGGVYLDLDVVVVKPFDTLAKNWAASESPKTVAAGALAFSKDPLGRKFANASISDLVKNFKGNIWGQNGPQVITRVLKKMCSTKVISKMSAKKCQGFEVYGPKLFYPISWQKAKLYFGSKKLNVSLPYVYHVWNKVSAKYKVPKNSQYAIMAKKYCPNVYKTYGDNFGQ